MRIVQFEIPGMGRRLGVVVGDEVRDITSLRPELARVVDVFEAAQQAGRRLADFLQPLVDVPDIAPLSYVKLLGARPEGSWPFLHPPVDHVEPRRVLITGTGLTHLGGMAARDQMHAKAAEPSDEKKSDSRKMFEMGLQGGKPAAGQRGVAPEWFYKGNGANVRGHGWTLEVPPFAPDGGEEPEIVGCYVIDASGVPRRLGFALGNEWSDHVTEKMNYLYLAPSKLRPCAIGPDLVTESDFQEIRLRCTVRRRGEVIYDSGELYSGERHMCHSLANCEDHHFKYPQHRQPGDVHVHFFGTSKLSHGSRSWVYEDGDEIRIEAPGFSAPLVNVVRVVPKDHAPLHVEPA